MEFSVENNIKAVLKSMDKVAKDQIPFATSLALNNLGKEVAYSLSQAMKSDLDRPTPFTQRAFMTNTGNFFGQRATKRNLVAIIRPKAIQAEYLKWQVRGGTRSPKKRTIAVPFAKNAKLNQYGNVPNRKAGLIKNKNQFSGEIKGVGGIWERYGKGEGRGVRLIHAYEQRAQYKPRFDIWAVARKVVSRKFNKIFEHALRYASSTSK
jgi:hypothetical protein